EIRKHVAVYRCKRMDSTLAFYLRQSRNELLVEIQLIRRDSALLGRGHVILLSGCHAHGISNSSSSSDPIGCPGGVASAGTVTNLSGSFQKRSISSSAPAQCAS